MTGTGTGTGLGPGSLDGKLLAFDVDGTLVGAGGAVTGRTARAIDAAVAAGATATLATGRDWTGVVDILEAVPGLSYAVCVNGIEIMRSDGTELHVDAMPVDAALEAVDILRRVLPDISIAAGLAGRLVVEPAVAARFDPGIGVLEPVDDIVAAIGPGVRDLVLWHPTLCEDLEHFHAVCAAALHVPGIDVAFTGLPMIEIVPEGCGKDTGLAWLARHVGIDRSDTIAFGDGLNDLAMLAWAGHGVAMGQAAPEVRAVADEVAERHDADGVASWIEAHLPR